MSKTLTLTLSAIVTMFAEDNHSRSGFHGFEHKHLEAGVNALLDYGYSPTLGPVGVIETKEKNLSFDEVMDGLIEANEAWQKDWKFGDPQDKDTSLTIKWEEASRLFKGFKASAKPLQGYKVGYGFHRSAQLIIIAALGLADRAKVPIEIPTMIIKSEDEARALNIQENSTHHISADLNMADYVKMAYEAMVRDRSLANSESKLATAIHLPKGKRGLIQRAYGMGLMLLNNRDTEGFFAEFFAKDLPARINNKNASNAAFRDLKTIDEIVRAIGDTPTPAVNAAKLAGFKDKTGSNFNGYSAELIEAILSGDEKTVGELVVARPTEILEKIAKKAEVGNQPVWAERYRILIAQLDKWAAEDREGKKNDTTTPEHLER